MIYKIHPSRMPWQLCVKSRILAVFYGRKRVLYERVDERDMYAFMDIHT